MSFPHPPFLPPDEPAPQPPARPVCDTRDPDYTLWLLQAGLDGTMQFLESAGLLVQEVVCQALAQLVVSVALATKMVLDRVTAEQGRQMMLAAVAARVLVIAGELRRAVPSAWQPDAAELDVLEAFCQTGRWKMDRPADLVEAVKRQVRRRAVAVLGPHDAVLIGLMLTVEGRAAEAARMLDLDSRLARDTLARVWRRFERAVLRQVEEALHKGGRRVPPRYSLN